MSSSNTDNQERMYDYHKHNLVYIGDYVKFADGKAGVALGATLLMLGFFGKIAKINGFSDLSFGEYSLLIGLIPLVAACYFFILKVLWPSYPTTSNAYMSWGGIGSFSDSQEYANHLDSKSTDQFIKDMTEQNYNIAKVCLNKYKNLKIGFICLTVGAVIEAISWFFIK